MSNELRFTPGDAEWKRLRELGLSNLYFFAGVILKYGDPVTMTERMHKLMCRVVEKRTGVPELDECPQRMIQMPRGTAKSTLVSQAYVIQRICQNPDIAILIANEKLENAQTFLAAIKHAFERNELFQALYPEVIPPDFQKAKWNETEIVVPRQTGRKEPTVKCQGVGAALASMHPDLIIVDDMVSREAAENARRGDGELTGAINRWVNQLVPLLNQGAQPFPEIIFLGCVAKDAKVLMADGSWLAIQEIQVGEGVLSWDVDQQALVPQRVSGVWPQGVSPVLRIRTNRHDLRVTANHPFLRAPGKRTGGHTRWVRADELRVGDYVQVVKNTPESETPSDIPGFGPATDDFLWLFGYLLGDGWITKYKTRASHVVCCAIGTHANLNARAEHLLHQYLGNKVTTTKFGYFRVEANEGGRRLAALGLTPGIKAKDKRVPEWVFRLNPSEKRSFLMGLIDADGSYLHRERTSKGKMGYAFFSASKGLVEDVRLLGMTCNLRPTRMYSRSRMIQAPNSPAPVLTHEYRTDLREERGAKHIRKWKITSIEHAESVETFDLSVEGTENFIAEGFVVHNTRWYRGDPYEHVEHAFGYGMPRKTWHLGLKLQNGDIQSLPVHRIGDLVLFTRQVVENGQPSWPERPGYDLESLAKFRLRDPALYAANMMNDPSDEITATFKEGWLQFYDWTGDQSVTFIDDQAKTRNYLLADLDILVLVDPGGFGRKKGSDRSRGAILVTGSIPGEVPQHLILDCYSDQVPYTVVQNKILDMIQRYPPRRCYIEEVGQQAAFYDQVVAEAKKRNLPVAFDKLTPKNEQKDARILQLEPYFQRGLIRFGKGPQFHELREQYRSWPTPRADLLDVLAYGPQVWRQQRVHGPRPEQRQAQEKEAFLKRMGVSLRL